MHNPARAAAVSGLGGIFVFVGELFVCAGTAIICYLTMTNYDDLNVSEPVFLTLLCFLIGYGIGAAFMGVFGLSANTILHCFILDE